MQSAELVLLFFLIAVVYASAGFGGGSSYLAAMALFGLSMEAMRPAALLCNIVVVAGGTWIFRKKGFLDFRKTVPICVASMPLAFWGGLTPLKEKTFFLLLGGSLIVSAVLMMIQKRQTEGDARKSLGPGQKTTWLPAALGGAIGYLSGMVGIGGGIFLAPVLHLLRWDTPKRIAATASFFILLNSVFGLVGQLWAGQARLDTGFLLPLLSTVFLGGQLGSRLTAFRLHQSHVRWITAALILYAGLNILIKNS